MGTLLPNGSIALLKGGNKRLMIKTMGGEE
ncbi:DUF4176 domain-containing protein [Virgibacillus sp. MSJ-26]|nr:DUF4176 domain-containing protein [Virgibacillus sp. MSJ-26]MBU5465366.1 DUF4176 domain-containing protein [Virgibacillus sp. MSJ-26]